MPPIAAHVAADAPQTAPNSSDDTTVTTPEGVELEATPVYYSPAKDLTLLRVGTDLPVLTLAAGSESGQNAAVLGYPENGPYAVTPARVGETRSTISEDSYGNGPITRTITSLAGLVRSGNSGGPLIDARGQVIGVVFAATTGGRAGGFAIPAEQVAEAVAEARAGVVDTGPCTA